MTPAPGPAKLVAPSPRRRHPARLVLVTCCAGWLLAGCKPSPVVPTGPTQAAPTEVAAPAVTNPAPPILAPAVASQAPAMLPPSVPNLGVSMTCAESETVTVGQYLVENNVWGKQGMTDWRQCVGATTSPRGGLAARWTWDWKYEGDQVKAYPEVVFGHKPGFPKSTTDQLPRRLADIEAIELQYDVVSARAGTGNLAIDIWLTSQPAPTQFAVPPISHEVMIWLDVHGPMYAGGTERDTVTINGIPYRVFVGEQFGMGWRYIAFKPENTPLKPAATLEVLPYLQYLESKQWLTPTAYVSAINLGNEIISGSGQTQLNHFSVSVR